LDWPTIIDWDERYVHAIERALSGRKLDELLKLLDERHYLHPILLPALADVIRSQRDRAQGRPRDLTQRQDAVIRDAVDHMGDSADTIGLLASAYRVSTEAIRESLMRTAKPKGR
jgi:hypothetical protein